jgi:hypothetical protein
LSKAFSTGTSIYAADYDDGGAGVAYYDTTAADEGNEAGYRSGGVDIGWSSPAGAAYVGWTHTGEWMNYTVNATAGTYDVVARLSSASGGGSFHVDIDGKDVTGEITVPRTGSWDDFTNIAAGSITLAVGKHVMSVVMDSQGSSGFVADFEDFAIDKATAVKSIAKPTIVDGSVPNAAFGLTVTAASGSAVLLEWDDNSSNETGFFIERATSPNGKFARIATVLSSTKTSRGTGTRSYVNSRLVAGTTYYYRVVAVNTKGLSSFTSASGETKARR